MLRLWGLLVATLLLASACVTVAPASTQAAPTTAPPSLLGAGPTPPPNIPTPTEGPTQPALHTLPPPTPKVTPDPNVTPDPSAAQSFDVMALLNASVTVINLSDSDLAVQAAIHDPDSGDDVPVANFTLAPNQITQRSVIGGDTDSALPYNVTFSYPSGSAATGGSCVVSILNGDDYTFVAVNEGLTIAKNDAAPASLDDTLLATSSLCAEPPPPSVAP